MSYLDTEAGRIAERVLRQVAEQDEPCEFEMQAGTDVCNRVPIKLLMNGDVITAEREVVRKLRGPYKTRANQTEEERKRLDRERKRVYRLRSQGAVRGWGNMTAEERSVEMIRRQRVAKGLEPPRPRARQHKRPMGGVA